jgi:histidinol-phosphate aminotransferase
MAAVPSNILVILDEAYIEFVTDRSVVDGSTLSGRYPNLVVARTFSKAYGLAGLRIGYAVGPEYILDAARTTSIPLSVTEPAQRAAVVSLDHEEVLLERVRRLSVLRDQVWLALLDQGWSVPQPHGNFVWLATGAATAEAAEVFARAGIVVRPLGADGIRVSIGESQSVDKLLKAAAEVVRTLPIPVRQPALD